ncbi:HlyD family secretion protein [Sphingomonas sp. SORGH_AS_0789]|nr:HlyD family secretion protein [Sphingomonas sp. SORGH_AS_0789]MDR6116527.1 membrane fusion protein (multidrug efflux system) [Sphingomonas sp. SORGH_AS_0789]
MVVIYWQAGIMNMDAKAGIEQPNDAKATSASGSRRKIIVAGIALTLAVGGSVWIATPASSESTDDAYVQADTSTVAPRVRGLVAQVYVRDNQRVRAGQPLVRIDAEEFDARLASARGDLADAQAGLLSARAALQGLAAEERLAAATVAAARTTIRSAQAEATRAGSDRRRYDALIASGAIARTEADRATAGAVVAEQGAARMRAQLAVAIEQAGVTAAKRPGLQAAVAAAEAHFNKAQAALDLARQDQGHTIIRAAIDGTVGNLQARVGDYVQPGSRLMLLVPLHALYVTANFKETQTARMLVGQPASIDVDALDGPALRGRVESFAPGSGSTFALLPFEPGTGNFTKIVQRVPVRIRLDPGQTIVDRLRPGLSVTAKVSFNHD